MLKMGYAIQILLLSEFLFLRPAGHITAFPARLQERVMLDIGFIEQIRFDAVYLLAITKGDGNLISSNTFLLSYPFSFPFLHFFF